MRPSDLDSRDVTRHRGRVFDVQPSTDDRSLMYPVAAVLPRAIVPVRKVWARGQILDQGSEGACVGHGVTAELAGRPMPVDLTIARVPDGAPHDPQAFAFWLYHQAQVVDEYPGEAYSGTSVNAGMKVARDAGFYDSYYWVDTRTEFRDALITLGPVVIAIPWSEGMYEAPRGELTASGDRVGWHCLLANGYDPALRWPTLAAAPREMVRLQNSWSTAWGRDGMSWITLDALWALLATPGADMAVAVGRHWPKP